MRLAGIALLNAHGGADEILQRIDRPTANEGGQIEGLF